MPSAKYGFNGNPTSVSVKTGSYSIPAGNYAFVTAQCAAGETFSIDGTVALNGPVAVAVKSEQTTNATNCTYTVPAGCQFRGQVYSTNTALETVFVAGAQVGSIAASTTTMKGGMEVIAGPAQIVQISANGSANRHITGFVTTGGEAVSTASFWVPTGTALTTSSGRYTVALF